MWRPWGVMVRLIDAVGDTFRDCTCYEQNR